MATETDDTGLLAIGGVGLLAIGALAVALLRGGGRRVINIPSNFGSGSGSGSGSSTDFAETGDSRVTEPADETAPDTPQGDYTYRDPADNPANSDTSLEFGDLTPLDGSTGSSGGSSVVEWGSGSGSTTDGSSSTDSTTDGSSSSGSSSGGLYDTVAGGADHLAGSTDEWVGRNTPGWL